MKKEDMVLISAYTGYMLCKEFSEVQKLVEEKVGRPIYTHEFAREDTQLEIRKVLLPDIKKLINEVYK